MRKKQLLNQIEEDIKSLKKQSKFYKDKMDEITYDISYNEKLISKLKDYYNMIKGDNKNE